MADVKKFTALIDLIKKYEGFSGDPSVFKIPLEKIHICFQKYPGVDNAAIIKDGPEAEFIMPGLMYPVKVKPVNGVYTVGLPTKKTGTFKIFQTVFNVQHRDKGDLEKSSDSNLSINNWQTTHGAKTKLGQLQRLQMLGYYIGPVYKNLGASHNREYEKAVLNYQTHSKTLFIDGKALDKTSNELDSTIGKNKAADDNIQHVRITLVRFKRYVKGSIAGATNNAPHPDDRGGIGAVVGVTKQDKIITEGDKITPEWLKPRVHLERNRITVGAPLYIDTDSPDTVQIVEPAPNTPLVGNQKEVICFAGIKETKGSLPRIRVRLGNPKGPIIGEMEVNISELRIVKCAAYRMTILGAAGAAVAGDTTVRSVADIRKFFNQLNAIWRPLGIHFEVKSIEDQTIRLSHHGWLSNGVPVDASGHDEHDQMWIKFNKPNRVNIFFVTRIRDRTAALPAETWSDNTLGQGWSRRSATKAGAGFQPGVTVGDNSHAQTVAHELGHVLALTRHAQAHSDEKNAAKNYLREDSWSRARLMAMYSKYSNRGFQNIEYGWSGGLIKAGCFMAIRNYGKYDLTDNELEIARKVSKNPY